MDFVNPNKIKSKVIDQNLGRSDFVLNGPYTYYLYRALRSDILIEDYLLSFTIYVLKKPAGSQVQVNNLSIVVEEGDAIQFESTSAKLVFAGPGIEILIAGTNANHYYKTGVSHIPAAGIYKVNKPWGHELWLNGQHKGYALKQIFINSGNKTSLQYHNLKHETNVLFSGKLKLHFKSNKQVPNDNVAPKDISFTEINPLTSMNILPNVLHRIEAVTNVLLYETSTPHLDDVIRVSDDSNRGHGRIKGEHSG